MKKVLPKLLFFLLILIVGAGSYAGAYFTFKPQLDDLKSQVSALQADPSTDQLRKDAYASIVAADYSPSTLRTAMDKGEIDFVLVDVRDSASYEAGHIKGAINIPADKGDADTIAKFKDALEKGKADRKSYVVVYCYTAFCTKGAKVANLLAQNDIPAMHMTIGYQEWEFEPQLWNQHGPSADSFKVDQYVQRGTEPGTVELSQDFLSRPCSLVEEYSC